MLRLLLRILYPVAVMGYIVECLILGLFMLAVCFGYIVPGLQGLVSDPAYRAAYVMVIFVGLGMIAFVMWYLRMTNPRRLRDW